MPTDNHASRMAAASPPGRSSCVKMASASVCVSPGMFETNEIVAPNSPSALAKPMMRPASRPGSASGNVIVRNVQSGLAPSVAGGLLESPIDVLDPELDRADHQRKRHHPRRQRRASPAKRKLKAEVLLEPGADGSAAAEDAKQKVASHDRRHDQRQMDEHVEQAAAPEAGPREHPGDRDRRNRRWRRSRRPRLSG